MDIFIIIILFVVGIILGIVFTKYFARKKNTIPVDSVEVIDTTNENSIVETKTEELIIGNPVNPDITIKRFEPNALVKTEDIPLNIGIKAGIGSLLQQAPNLISSSSNIVTNSFQLVFKPEVMQGLQNGTYNLMKAVEGGIRPIATEGGKVVGHARIIETTSINPATAALAVWQILAIITAQKFLSDINKKLEKISENVELLKDFLENERYGKLMGNLNYLRHLYNTMSGYNLKEREINIYAQKIEDIELECDQIMKSLSLNLPNILKKANSLEMNGMGLKERVENAKNRILEYENNLKPYLMAMYVRAAAAKIKCALPIEKISAQNRILELNNTAQEIITMNRNFDNTIRNKTHYIGSFWSAPQTNEEYKTTLTEFLNKSSNYNEELTMEIKKVLDETEESMLIYNKESDKPLSLVVKLAENGEVQEIKKLTE